VGDVPAARRTPTELRKDLTARLAVFVKLDDSAVTVEVAQIKSYRITVTGNVVRPGVLESARYITVGEAIALSGGPNQFADPDETILVRTRPNGQVVKIPIRYDLIAQGRALDQDIPLLRGDLVHVP
jgi:polysaccharide biosynthesis/export protein